MARVYNSLDYQELELFLNKVAEAILQNNLSLFLGAGSSMQYGAMSWNALLNKVFNGNKKWNNIERAQYAELKGIDIKKSVADVISSVYIDSSKTNTYLYHLLDFDFKSLWTTNYDCVIENVLEKEKSKTYIPVYKYVHFQNLSYPEGYFLYKINGNGSQEDAGSIVITHEDFIDYRRTHEAYLILLKRELLCNSFLFLGCSFDDDILRICIKDILNCIDNSEKNYLTNHFAIIAEENADKLDFICKDMCKHYKINCLSVNNINQAYIVAYGIACKVKYNSIFVSGAKRFERYSEMENWGKNVCQQMVNAFMDIKEFPFKFISGMGMSIGNFVSGTIKKNCRGKNTNRYLQMDPFPFTDSDANRKHRKAIINKAGIFIFLYGDVDTSQVPVEQSGMWQEYCYAKSNENSIVIAIPCGEDSISSYIFLNELNDKSSFSFEYQELIKQFDYKINNELFFEQLVKKVILNARKKMDQIIKSIVEQLQNFH